MGILVLKLFLVKLVHLISYIVKLLYKEAYSLAKAFQVTSLIQQMDGSLGKIIEVLGTNQRLSLYTNQNLRKLTIYSTLFVLD